MRKYLFLAFLSVVFLVKSEVKLNSLFSTNSVLQREQLLPVWGTAGNNEKITVEFNGQKVSTTAVDGKWMVTLQPMKANSTPQNLIVKGANILILKNVLVGDVWLCSGQSNMVFIMNKLLPTGSSMSKQAAFEDAKNYPTIRQFGVTRPLDSTVDSVRTDVNGRWTVCDQNSVGNFSAVAYFFAVELSKKLQVPIGILNSSIGGSCAERWISLSEVKSNPELNYIAEIYNKSLTELPIRFEKYNKELPVKMEKFYADSLAAKNEGKRIPSKPAPPKVAYSGPVGGYYNYMIQPLFKFPIKGVVWYQGEANSGANQAPKYRKLLTGLIKSWRDGFHSANLPFIAIQIPGLKNQFPEIRESQFLAVKNTPYTGLVVISDISDTLDVHPGNKQPVGERAALTALALAYNQKIEFSGPVYESMKVDGNKVYLSFSHIGGGLVAKNGNLRNFEVAGNDNVYYPALAEINGNSIIVSSSKVASPKNARMGWKNISICNLYNQEGLPASIFRTDFISEK